MRGTLHHKTHDRLQPLQARRRDQLLPQLVRLRRQVVPRGVHKAPAAGADLALQLPVRPGGNAVKHAQEVRRGGRRPLRQLGGHLAGLLRDKRLRAARAGMRDVHRHCKRGARVGDVVQEDALQRGGARVRHAHGAADKVAHAAVPHRVLWGVLRQAARVQRLGEHDAARARRAVLVHQHHALPEDAVVQLLGGHEQHARREALHALAVPDEHHAQPPKAVHAHDDAQPARVHRGQQAAQEQRRREQQAVRPCAQQQHQHQRQVRPGRACEAKREEADAQRAAQAAQAGHHARAPFRPRRRHAELGLAHAALLGALVIRAALGCQHALLPLAQALEVHVLLGPDAAAGRQQLADFVRLLEANPAHVQLSHLLASS
mmetsp:Transcript_8687/g.21919  ORF Transcript_8687/g.21919 Transcript_8687/m.21919 type:complete len:375 (+) Transcript_8687:310-1434(+)